MGWHHFGKHKLCSLQYNLEWIRDQVLGKFDIGSIDTYCERADLRNINHLYSLAPAVLKEEFHRCVYSPVSLPQYVKWHFLLQIAFTRKIILELTHN